MIIRMARPLLLTAIAFAGFGLQGCQSDKHTMVEPAAGTTIVCSMCYDEIYTMRHSTGSRWGTTYEKTHTRHMCPGCKTEMSIYDENGVLMVKCAKCAPNGLACDKCLPPKDYTPPK